MTAARRICEEIVEEQIDHLKHIATQSSEANSLHRLALVWAERSMLNNHAEGMRAEETVEVDTQGVVEGCG